MFNMAFVNSEYAPGGGGQAEDREASSCNAVQLPRFLVLRFVNTSYASTTEKLQL